VLHIRGAKVPVIRGGTQERKGKQKETALIDYRDYKTMPHIEKRGLLPKGEKEEFYNQS